MVYLTQKELIHTIKTINDTLYSSIQLSRFAVEIIDSYQFQRLRHLKQLGSSQYIFPNSIHTRFEHSIGTYYLCKQLTHRLSDSTDINEMNKYLRIIPYLSDYINTNYENKLCHFDEYLQELVNIGALCHDLGHGAFSHIFDDHFIKRSDYKDHPNAVHETRSGLILTDIINSSDKLSIPEQHINFIKSIINPSCENTGFIYQIVSNNMNSLDIDKFDYITRDTNILGIQCGFDYKRLIDHALIIDNNITYPEQCMFDIYELFSMRYRMHKQVYSHKGVISASLMITDIMDGCNKVLNINESICDMNDFCKITDTYILEFLNYIEFMDTKIKENMTKTLDIFNRLNKHNLYKCIGHITTKNKINLDKNIIFENYPNFLNDIIIYQSKIGYVSGNKSNPLDDIYIYKTKNKKSAHIAKQNISHLIGDTYQECLNLVFFKRDDDFSKNIIMPKLKSCFNNYILCNTNT
jgi:deoxynucleoside triphosphate triphosphohydrolase SAMHD1